MPRGRGRGKRDKGSPAPGFDLLKDKKVNSPGDLYTFPFPDPTGSMLHCDPGLAHQQQLQYNDNPYSQMGMQSYYQHEQQLHQQHPGMSQMPPPVMGGKIYPINQPMIFNTSNPNAPPIYPCGVCHKEVHDNDQAILCESGCNFWFHRICTGLTEAAYQMLTKEVYAEWVCDKCLTTKNIPLVKMKP